VDVGISLKELLAWNEEVADFWKAHLDANPHLLELPCDIGGDEERAGICAPYLGSRTALGSEAGWSASKRERRNAHRTARCDFRFTRSGRGYLPRTAHRR